MTTVKEEILSRLGKIEASISSLTRRVEQLELRPASTGDEWLDEPTHHDSNGREHLVKRSRPRRVWQEGELDQVFNVYTELRKRSPGLTTYCIAKKIGKLLDRPTGSVYTALINFGAPKDGKSGFAIDTNGSK